MFVIALESYCMKIVMINPVDKSDFILSQNAFQIFAVILVELAKSEDCGFSCSELAVQKVPVSCKYKSNQEISTKLCWMMCYPALNKLYHFHP